MNQRSAKKSVYKTASMLALLLLLTATALGQDSSNMPAAQKVEAGKVDIRVTLVDQKGKAVEGQAIKVLLAANADAEGCPAKCYKIDTCKQDCIKCCPRARVFEGRTDDDGELKIKERVDPGDYRLYSLKDDVITPNYYTPATVESGETEKVRLDLMEAVAATPTPK